MSIAKGGNSVLAWKEEASYNTAPSGDWNSIPINSETLAENINTIQAEDLRSDRRNPSLRGGNIATGGNLVHDFGYNRSTGFFKHLLAVTPTTTVLYPAQLKVGTVKRGDYALNADGDVFICKQGGTIATATGLNTATSGDVTVDDTEWTYLADVGTGTATNAAALAAKAYVVGDYVLNAVEDTFVCTKAGTVTGGSTTALDGVTSGETTVDDAKFLYLSPSNLAKTFKFYKHLYLAGINFPTVGLSFEKGIVGGTTAQYIAFTGGRINSLELNVPQEGIVKATWNMLFRKSINKATSSGAGTVKIEAEDPFSGYDGLMHLNDTDWNGDSAQVNRGVYKSFSATIANTVAEDVYSIGSRFRQDLPEGTRKASGKMTLYFADPAEYTYFKNETKISLGISFVHDGCLVFLKFPEVKITGDGTPKISGQGVLTADYDWTCFYQNNTEEQAGGADIIVEVHNKQATPLL